MRRVVRLCSLVKLGSYPPTEPGEDRASIFLGHCSSKGLQIYGETSWVVKLVRGCKISISKGLRKNCNCKFSKVNLLRKGNSADYSQKETGLKLG